MHACKVVTALPAGLLYVIDGFASSLKLGADVIVACLGIDVNDHEPLPLQLTAKV